MLPCFGCIDGEEEFFLVIEVLKALMPGVDAWLFCVLVVFVIHSHCFGFQ